MLGGYPIADHILVFAREANGNVPPLRVLKGPDAFRRVGSVAVDPVRNLLLVAGETPAGAKAVMMFDRTAQGNAKPRRVVLGPSGRMLVSPEKGVFLVVIKPPRGGVEEEIGRTTPGLSAMAGDQDYVGVWSIDDSGEVPPRWMIGGPGGVHQWMYGVNLDPKHKTVLITDMRLNAVATYSFPEIC